VNSELTGGCVAGKDKLILYVRDISCIVAGTVCTADWHHVLLTPPDTTYTDTYLHIYAPLHIRDATMRVEWKMAFWPISGVFAYFATIKKLFSKNLSVHIKTPPLCQ